MSVARIQPDGGRSFASATAICCTAPTPSAFVETILPWCSSQTGKTIVAKFDGGQLKSDRSI